MKRTYLIGGIAVLVALGGTLLFLQQMRGGKRSYEGRGRVAGFGQEGHTLIVEHEAIEGYMPAMTMPLTARSPDEIEELQIGDAIRFTLATAQDSSWITEVRKLPDSAVAQHPAGEMSKTEKVATSKGVPMLEEGDKVPGFQLTDQRGEPVRLSDYQGKALVLTFIYTRCPLPTYCPLMSKNLARLQERLPAKLEDQVHLLSISFDPEHDTPKVLRNYAKRYEADFDTWTFATGTPEEIGRVTARFGVFTKKSGKQIIHNLTTALIGPKGQVRRLWRGNDWQPEDVLHALRQMRRPPS